MTALGLVLVAVLVLAVAVIIGGAISVLRLRPGETAPDARPSIIETA